MAKKPKKLEDLFHETLKDIYFAENKILKTLPKMAKAAQSKELRRLTWTKLPRTYPERRSEQAFSPQGATKSLRGLGEIGAGEGARTLDPDLGKVEIVPAVQKTKPRSTSLQIP